MTNNQQIWNKHYFPSWVLNTEYTKVELFYDRFEMQSFTRTVSERAQWAGKYTHPFAFSTHYCNTCGNKAVGQLKEKSPNLYLNASKTSAWIMIYVTGNHDFPWHVSICTWICGLESPGSVLHPDLCGKEQEANFVCEKNCTYQKKVNLQLLCVCAGSNWGMTVTCLHKWHCHIHEISLDGYHHEKSIMNSGKHFVYKNKMFWICIKLNLLFEKTTLFCIRALHHL